MPFCFIFKHKNFHAMDARLQRRYPHWSHEPTANWGSEDKPIRRMVAGLKTGGIEEKLIILSIANSRTPTGALATGSLTPNWRAVTCFWGLSV